MNGKSYNPVKLGRIRRYRKHVKIGNKAFGINSNGNKWETLIAMASELQKEEIRQGE